MCKFCNIRFWKIILKAFIMKELLMNDRPHLDHCIQLYYNVEYIQCIISPVDILHGRLFFCEPGFSNVTKSRDVVLCTHHKTVSTRPVVSEHNYLFDTLCVPIKPVDGT